MPSVHPSSIVSDECELAPDVEIGPYCVLSGRVRLGAGVHLVAGVHLQGPVTIGDRTQVYPGACLGFPGQDVKFKLGDPTAGVVIGSDCLLREHVTIHAATNTEKPTTVGDGVFMMAQSHLGHDGHLERYVVMVNNTAVGGHGWVGERAIMGGSSVLHQHGRIGKLAFVSGVIGVPNDVPPFCTVGDRNMLTGINLVGMRRAGYSREDITAVREAFRSVLRRQIPMPEMVQMLRERGAEHPPVMEMADFIDQPDRRPITPSVGRPPRVLAYWLRRMGMAESIPDEELVD